MEILFMISTVTTSQTLLTPGFAKIILRLCNPDELARDTLEENDPGLA